MRFRDQDHRHVATVDQLQAEMSSAGINPYQYVLWDHQRDLWSPMGSFQVTAVSDGYQLDSIDRGSIVHEGTFSDQRSVVHFVLSHTDPQPPQTPEQRARVAAAGRRAQVENAAFRERLEAETAERIQALDDEE